METTDSAMTPVRLSSNAFRIHDKAEIILCASLFYFRIPRALWRERMMQLRAFGYNCIDVYFPWNYHEQKQGAWDFSGEKDITAFLQMAKEVGLWVVARPGPYICSEWDGGGLPAYLYTIDGMKLRENNPAFLNAVSKWYDQVLPLLNRYQLGENGTIICVQLENELDFYGCADPNGYISALRDMAIEHEITVPLIACAGQGGLLEASGLADGVVPTSNFYPNDRDPVFEEKVLHYKNVLEGMGHPLLVTETNRSHFLLRRLLSCGVKLLGPYLQVSGTDFGFTNGTNNWGSPLAFLTSDYDFGGMISPEGHIRQEAYEGLMLARMMEAYGSSIAEAELAPKESIRIEATPKTAIAGPNTLKLGDGGYLVFVSNVGEYAADVSFEVNDIRVPQQTKLSIEHRRSLALPFGVPLQTWGVEGTLLYATAELFQHRRCDSKTTLLFHTDSEGEIALRIDNSTLLETTNLSASEKDGVVILTFGSGDIALCKLELPDGHVLELITMGRSEALLIEDMNEDGVVRIGPKIEYCKDVAEFPIQWSYNHIQANLPMADSHSVAADKADFLENYGIYRGFAWYEANMVSNQAAVTKGILVQKASDIISLYTGGDYVTTVVPGGTGYYIPIESELSSDRILARVEIWGHTNFDDIRLPALRLNAMKGMKGLVSVTNILNLTQNWKVKSVNNRIIREDLTNNSADDLLWPIVSFGGWLSQSSPALEYFRNSFEAAKDADSWTIHFKGIQATAHVFVGGQDAGRIDLSDPFVDITPFVEPGEKVQVTVFMERPLGVSAGQVIVYEGMSSKKWRISSCQEGQLWAYAQSASQAIDTELPVTMNAGEMGWLLGEMTDSNDGKGWRVKAKGSNIKLTVLFNEHLVGRLWLQDGGARPAFTGGDPDSFYLPGPWFQDGSSKLAVLLEAVHGESPSRLDALSFIPVSKQVRKLKV